MSHNPSTLPLAKAECNSTTIMSALQESASGDVRRIATLDRLRRACDHIVDTHRDLSLREIESHCKSSFEAGPRAQTISNDKGLHAYVEARRQEVAIPERRKAGSTLDRGIEEINDPDLRSRMRVLLEEHRLLTARHLILTQGLARLVPPLDLDAILLGRRDIQNGSSSKKVARFTDEQVSALRHLITVLQDSAWLGRLGLETDQGDIVGRGVRETLITNLQIRLVESLLDALAYETSANPVTLK